MKTYVMNRYWILFVCIYFFSCHSDRHEAPKARIAKGNIHYGGVLRINEIEDFRSLFPLNITETTSAQIAYQVYEGLVKLSSADLSVRPCLAEKWAVNDSANVFTFYIRKGVRYSDDACFEGSKGRELKAADVKYCFDKICEAQADNQGYWLFRGKVFGADGYYQSTQKKAPLSSGVSGIRVVDDYTIQIRLLHPFAGFLHMLTTPFAFIYPKEAFDAYHEEMRTHCVGTGPFYVDQLKEGEGVVLKRNENYWGMDSLGNTLPYLDAIQYSFIKEKKTELMEFRKGNLDVVHQLPLEMIDDVVGELDDAKRQSRSFDVHTLPAMSIQYYGFQHQGSIFNRKEVRQAFNYAIDREKIVDFTLQGEGLPAIHGIVPPAFKAYHTDAVRGYEFNPGKAQKLMAIAGYPQGKKFPAVTLQINSGGSRNLQVAEVIQKMLKENLNVEVSFEVMPFAQHLENLEAGRAPFWRSAWVADYPDPENFLNLLFGEHVPAKKSERSYINSVRYMSLAFDSVFRNAQHQVDLEKRYALLQKADQIAMDDAAIMPLFYDEYTDLVQKRVLNYHVNAMNFQDFTSVYLMASEKKK